MNLGGKKIGPDATGRDREIMVAPRGGSISHIPVIRPAGNDETVRRFREDVDKKLSNRGRIDPSLVLIVAAVMAAVSAVVITRPDAKSKVVPEPVRGFWYDGEVLGDEVDCLRTWFAAQCSQFTDEGQAFLDRKCNQDSLDELGTDLDAIVFARDAVFEAAGMDSPEMWERVDGKLGNLNIKRAWPSGDYDTFCGTTFYNGRGYKTHCGGMIFPVNKKGAFTKRVFSRSGK
jgi:hypothetical protein